MIVVIVELQTIPGGLQVEPEAGRTGSRLPAGDRPGDPDRDQGKQSLPRRLRRHGPSARDVDAAQEPPRVDPPQPGR